MIKFTVCLRSTREERRENRLGRGAPGWKICLFLPTRSCDQ